MKRSRKPVIVAGDFNTFWGEHEMTLFMEAAGLRSANLDRLPSYPAEAAHGTRLHPVHARASRSTSFDVPAVTLSDHRPLVCDFRLTGEQLAAA